MRRLLGGVTVIAAGVAGVYGLMVWDAHFLLLAAFGAICGGLAGWAVWGRRSVLPAAAIGFILPLAYLPLWLVFDLPPDTGINL